MQVHVIRVIRLPFFDNPFRMLAIGGRKSQRIASCHGLNQLPHETVQCVVTESISLGVVFGGLDERFVFDDGVGQLLGGF